MVKTVDLIVTSAIMFEGEMARKGDVLEGVPEREAADYLRRGKAKLAPNQGRRDSESQRDQLEALKVGELKVEAADLNIEGHASMSKAQLVDAILAVAADGDDD